LKSFIENNLTNPVLLKYDIWRVLFLFNESYFRDFVNFNKSKSLVQLVIENCVIV